MYCRNHVVPVGFQRGRAESDGQDGITSLSDDDGAEPVPRQSNIWPPPLSDHQVSPVHRQQVSSRPSPPLSSTEHPTVNEMEGCQTSVEVGMTRPYSPPWITSVRTATISTKSLTFTPCAGQTILLILPSLLSSHRADCFSSGYFQYCLQALLLEEDRFVNMAQVIGRWLMLFIVFPCYSMFNV